MVGMLIRKKIVEDLSRESNKIRKKRIKWKRFRWTALNGEAGESNKVEREKASRSIVAVEGEKRLNHKLRLKITNRQRALVNGISSQNNYGA